MLPRKTALSLLFTVCILKTGSRRNDIAGKDGQRGGRSTNCEFLLVILLGTAAVFLSPSKPLLGGKIFLRDDLRESQRSANLRSVNETTIDNKASFIGATKKLLEPNKIDWSSGGGAAAPSFGNWWQEYVDAVLVGYTPSNNTDWCQSSHTTSQNSGLYLLKIHKSASSTAAAVALQIEESIASQKGLSHPCQSFVRHGDNYTKCEQPFLLWSIVQQPDKRSISSYFFHKISRNGKAYDSNQQSKILEQEKNYQIEYMAKMEKGEIVIHMNAFSLYQPL